MILCVPDKEIRVGCARSGGSSWRSGEGLSGPMSGEQPFAPGLCTRGQAGRGSPRRGRRRKGSQPGFPRVAGELRETALWIGSWRRERRRGCLDPGLPSVSIAKPDAWCGMFARRQPSDRLCSLRNATTPPCGGVVEGLSKAIRLLSDDDGPRGQRRRGGRARPGPARGCRSRRPSSGWEQSYRRRRTTGRCHCWRC
jgi:hypothetical protein